MTRIQKTHNRIKNNSGFTLIELLVVLILLGILLSVTIVGGLAWQDWAQFRHEEAVAEEIFYAAQNQLTELDSSGALYYNVTKELEKGATGSNKYNSTYMIPEFENVVYKAGENGKYRLNTIWINTNLTTEPGELLKLQASAGDYDKYLKGSLGSNTSAKLLFDLVSPYVSDKSVLNGAIIIEFSPEAGQVFSVCYSDRASSLVYADGDTDAEGNVSISVMNRIMQEREKVMLGYYSVDNITQKVRGRGNNAAELDFQIQNKEVLQFVITDKENKLVSTDSLMFNIYDGTTSKEVMEFKVPYSAIKVGASYKDGLDAATKNPAVVSVAFKNNLGKYSGSKDFRIPVFFDNTTQKYYVIMDAADIQAETISYSKSIYFGGAGEDEEAFRNTYSFYRFGLSEAVSSIYGTVKISHSDNSSTGACDSYSDASVGFHKDQSGVKGECTAFASYKQTGDEVNIDLTNIRHLYNVRYETDYKTASRKTIKNTFNVKADMSWASFVSKNSDTGINYFLNSYSASDVSIKSGINYSGANISPDLNSKVTTKNYPFPGFRKLDKYDKFTQAEDTNYAISDLYISVTGNITYGVYDTEADAISTKCSSDYKYTQGEKANYTELNSEGNNAARAGKMPLGLFAENQGEISNIILNRHVVKGLEQMNNSGQDIVYTCMVGGFAGNNLGKISNLTLLDNTSNDSTSAKANKTVINGRTDVGGIIGRQSFVVSESNRNITISKMKNYGSVSGLENIGGIVGRVYTRFVTDKTDVPERFSEVYGSATYNSSSVSTYAQVTNKYFYFHDGYNITDSYKSMTGEDVYRNDKVVISECMNRGKISGDSLAYKMIQNNTRIRVCKSSGTSFENVNLRACAFIGGIVGASIDGIMYDDESLKVNDRNLYPEICESYANGGEANIQLIDCNSFPEYSTSSMTALVSSEANSIKYDNYVGGLIGYGRLTSIENCNDKPDDVAKDDGVPRAFVIGHRYVGGVVGCSDGVRYDVGNASANSDGVNNRKYSVTNYNNVIGCTFVGGIAGSNGKGFYKYGNLCFRNPATSSAEMPTRIPGVENSPALLKNTLNTGSVICLKKMLGVNNAPDSFTLLTSDYWANIESSPRENYCGHCGGILGVNTDKIRNTDNIQSEATKNYIVKTINGSEIDYTNVDINAVVTEMDSSVFGGVSVGGLVGYQNGTGQGKHSINEESSDVSYVDAVVYGQNYVGGVAGCVQNGDYPKFDNVYPVKKSDSSSGMLVLGEDCVGGLVGRLQRDLQYHNAESITSAFTVIGRYSVGGYVGFDGYDSSARGVVNTSLELNNGTVKVYGKCYVGGLLGYSSAKHIDIPEDKKVISINNIDVNGEYFVGGIAGGIAARDKDGSTDHNILFVKKINVGNNINVNATSFAGGVSGLYTSTTGDHNEFLNHNGKPFKLANELCKYAGTDDEKLTGTYNKVVLPDNADITTTDIFDKSDRDVSLDFANYTNKVNVTTELFGGGLFGYVPNGLKITVKGFSNNGNILVNSSLPVSVVTESADKNAATTYSYLGGVIGRVPAGMKIVNCYNLVSGTDKYNSMGTYLGGLTEVNAGVISGDVETDENGTVTKVNSYLENNTEYKYGSGGIGAFAGVNGTTAAGCAGVIQYCKNNKAISSDSGFAGGIAAAQGGASTIRNCINIGSVGVDGAVSGAGIVASPSGSDTVTRCRNYGTISGDSRYGIAAGTVGTVSKNLEASGLTENSLAHDPVANNTSSALKDNFYISEMNESSSYGTGVAPSIINTGSVSYSVSCDTNITNNPPQASALYDRTNNTTDVYQFYMGKDKWFEFDYNIKRNENYGVKMSDFNIIWFPYNAWMTLRYRYSVTFTYSNSDGTTGTTTVDRDDLSLNGSTRIRDCIKAPQGVEITDIKIRMIYDDKMAGLNGGAEGCNVLYGYVYWTDTNGQHYITTNGENLDANTGYISFDSKVYAGDGQTIGGDFFYDRSPSSEKNQNSHYIMQIGDGTYMQTKRVCINVNSPSTGLEMNKIKLYWYYYGQNQNKYFQYKVRFTYLDSNLDEKTVTYTRKFDGFTVPDWSQGKDTLFYDEIPAVDIDGNYICPSGIEVIATMLDDDGNVITDNISQYYALSAITWFDKNGKERKIENSDNKYKLNDTDPKSYMTADTSAYVNGAQYLVSGQGSQGESADHWSKQLYLYDTGSGTYNLTYKRNGSVVQGSLMAEDISTNVISSAGTAQAKYEAFDNWFIGSFIDAAGYSSETFVDAGN